jgi:peptide/nickel transport system substrate-binding protein
MRNRTIQGKPLAALLVLAALTAALVLSACGSSSSGGSSGGSGSSSGSSGGSERLVVGIPALPITFDANFAPGQQSVESIVNLYDPLMCWKSGEDPEGFQAAEVAAAEKGVEPCLLSKIQVSDGGKTYTLHVKPGVKNAEGEELNAEDLKYTFDREFGTEAVGEYIMGVADVPSEKSITVIDPMTVQIKIPSPNPLFLRLLTIHTSNPFDKKIAEEHATSSDPWSSKWLAKNSAGFGAYTVKAFTSTEVIFAANPNYWNGAPGYSEIVYKLIPESSQRLALLQSGEIDVAEGLSALQLESLEGDEKFQTVATVKNEFVYAAINQDKEPLDDVKVRQALQYATPSEQIAEAVYKGKAEPTKNLLPANYPKYDGSLSPYKFDPEKAKELLKEAGVENLKLTITVNSDIQEHSDMAVLMKNGFAEAGIDLEIEKKPTAAYLAAAENGETELWLQQSYSVVEDVAYQYANYVAGYGTLSHDNYEEPKFEALIAKALSTPEGPARDTLIEEMQKIEVEQAPQLSIVTVPTIYGIAASVSGYTWYPTNQIRWDDLSPSE